MPPNHVVYVLIDGLRPDALRAALQAGEMPHLQTILGGEGHPRGWLTSVLAPAPSITFASQASLVTGAHPAQHDVLGNQFFDRFGMHRNGRPRHYAFDVGDTLELDDAVGVFTVGLASKCLGARTFYERAAARGQNTVVVGHMYANGAERWLPPKVDMLARVTKAPGPLRVTPAEFDTHVLHLALEALEDGLPSIFTVYLMGMDLYSHQHGPDAQRTYLRETLDGLLGRLWEAVQAAAPPDSPPLWLFAADHGHRPARFEETYAIPLRAFKPLFADLDMDLLDHPGEGRHSEAVVALNGSMAMLYLRQKGAPWAQPPDFEQAVLPLAHRLWEAHRSGRGVPELEGAVGGVLVRNVAAEGWRATYAALTPEGEMMPLEAWFQRWPPHTHADAVHRIRHMVSPLAGDIVLLLEPVGGKYFGHPMAGVHGGLSPEASEAAVALAWPGVDDVVWQGVRERFEEAVRLRCQVEDGRAPQTADVVTGLEAVLLG